MSGVVFSPLFAPDRFFFAGSGDVSSIVIPEVGHAVSIITTYYITKDIFLSSFNLTALSLFFPSSYNNILTSMSVKLPLILKRELKPQPHRQSSPQKEEPALRHSDPQGNYEDQFEDEIQEEAEKEPHQPETITVLKKQQQEQLQLQLIHKEEPKVDLSKRREELQKMLQQRMQQASTLKQTVSERKKQIKNIGEQIDRDLNRSLLRTAKQNTVSIRDIFSAPKPTSNKRINDLNEELRNVRIAIKRIKTDIAKISEGMMDPVTLLNQEKGVDFEACLRSSEEDLKRIQSEKDMLSEQIARGNKDFNEQQEKQRADQFAKLNAILTEVLTAQKQCKNSMNQLDRQDVLQMEKVKFFQERQGCIRQGKKMKQSEKDRMKMDEEVRQLIMDINDTIEQRNRIQSEKKNHVKALNNDIASLQSKNWQLCNRLRQIDSFLLQYYEKKAKRKEAKLDKTQKQSETAFDKSASGRIEVHSNFFQTPQATKTIEYDDKNKRSVPQVLSERKKNYEFFSKEGEEGEVQLSDEFLGGKLNISKLIIISDQTHIYSLKVIYECNQRQIEGLVLGGKNIPEEAKKIEINFSLDAMQIINFIHIGFGQDHFVSYFHLVTTQGRQQKWGNAEKSVKSDQKHVKKYEYCYLKGRVMELENGRFALSGVTMSTVYLSAK